MRSLTVLANVVLVVAALSQQAWCSDISDAKRLADGESVTLAQKVVTYSDTDYFYIEEDDRFIGIRVNKSSHGLVVGMRADVVGTMQTDLPGNMERYVSATSVEHSAPPNAYGGIETRQMGNNGVGGGDWFYDSGSGAGQKGATEAVGLNTVGLLVRTWGRYHQLDSTTFTVNDGSTCTIRCSVPSGFFLYSDWHYVVVTGVVSLYKSETGVYGPLIRVTGVQVILPVEAVSTPVAPTGELSPIAGGTYTYSALPSSCNQGHPVEYRYDWGDGTFSEWSASAEASHVWLDAGPKSIVVTARCQEHAGVTAGSSPLAVSVRQSGAIPGPYPGDMIYIPAGSFQMGNTGVGNDAIYGRTDEFPQHSVELSDYWIGKHEVTRGEYRLFMDAGGYSNQNYWSSDGWTWKGIRTQPEYWEAQQDFGSGVFTQADDHPVIGISYYEAEAFCNWANGHLPTEAQWEKAARWTGNGPRVYPWGNAWDDDKCNNYWDNNPAGGGCEEYETAPVGSYASGDNNYGCQDMAGNVWEWVQDWYISYPGSASPFDYTGSYRCLRGGSFFQDHFKYVRSGFRGTYTPESNWWTHGFRFAR